MSETTKSITTLSLSRGSLELLNSMLSQPGWTDKRRELTEAGKLQAVVDDLVFERPVYVGTINTENGNPTDPVAFRAHQVISRSWERTKVDVILTDPQWAAALLVVRHFTNDKKVGGSQFSSELLTAFKLTE